MKVTLTYSKSIDSDNIEGIEFEVGSKTYYLDTIIESDGLEHQWETRVWLDQFDCVVEDLVILENLNNQLKQFLIDSIEMDIMESTLTQIIQDSNIETI